MRLPQRWGLTDGKSVEQTESDLKALFQEPLWKELHLQVRRAGVVKAFQVGTWKEVGGVAGSRGNAGVAELG